MSFSLTQDFFACNAQSLFDAFYRTYGIDIVSVLLEKAKWFSVSKSSFRLLKRTCVYKDEAGEHDCFIVSFVMGKGNIHSKCHMYFDIKTLFFYGIDEITRITYREYL